MHFPVHQAASTGEADLVATFGVEAGDSLVLFVEIKPPTHLKYPSTRAAADAEMRSRFADLYDECRFPRLYGVSAMGKKICIYSLDLKDERSKIQPEQLSDSSNPLFESAPVSRWDLDITTEEGYKTFMKVVDDIKQMVKSQA